MTDHPRAIAARLCYSPNIAARSTGLAYAEVRAIRDLKATRSAAQKWIDPLVLAARWRIRTYSTSARLPWRMTRAS